MLTLVPKEIEAYAVDHTSPLPGYIDELVKVTHEKTTGAGMLSGPIEGMLLQFLVWASGARRVLEIGTFTGFSAQMMAAALPDDGRLITCDVNADSTVIAEEYWAKSPHGHKIELRMGPALETMATLDDVFDLVFIDADKENYTAYFDRALELLSPKGIVAIDNVLWSGRVLDPQDSSDRAIAALNDRIAGDPKLVHVLLPVRDGVMLVHRA